MRRMRKYIFMGVIARTPQTLTRQVASLQRTGGPAASKPHLWSRIRLGYLPSSPPSQCGEFAAAAADTGEEERMIDPIRSIATLKVSRPTR
jgi:hypothetical protein